MDLYDQLMVNYIQRNFGKEHYCVVNNQILITQQVYDNLTGLLYLNKQSDVEHYNFKPIDESIYKVCSVTELKLAKMFQLQVP